jgi:hypothetical protein
MAPVLLCNRGDESRDVAGRIGDRLRDALGARNVVQPGASNLKRARKAARSCRCLVVVLGHNPQFEDDGDDVRFLIEAALELGVSVVPVRIDTAEFPDSDTLPESLRPMLFQNGMQIRPDPNFDHDVERLLEAVRKPPSLSIVPSPREWLIDILSHSLMPMGVGALFYAIYCVLMYGIFRMLFGSNWYIEYAVAAFIAVPGFVIGARHGVLQAITGTVVMFLFSGSEGIGLLFTSETVITICQSLGVLKDSDTADLVALPFATGLSGVLLAAASSARRSLAAKQRGEDRPLRLNRDALLGGLAGLALGFVVCVLVLRLGRKVNPFYQAAWLSAVVVLSGIQMGLLDVMFARPRRKRLPDKVNA